MQSQASEACAVGAASQVFSKPYASADTRTLRPSRVIQDPPQRDSVDRPGRGRWKTHGTNRSRRGHGGALLALESSCSAFESVLRSSIPPDEMRSLRHGLWEFDPPIAYHESTAVDT
jgi:hypothetical protein